MIRRPLFIVAAVGLFLSGTAYAVCGGGLLFYQKDNNGWRYHGKRIEGADLDTFHVLPGQGSNAAFNPCARDSGYAADKAHVYREANTLQDADPATFLLLSDGYSRDATHVYYLETLLNGVEASTFKQIAPGFFKDSARVYLNGAAIKDADPATFLPLGNNAYPGTGLARDATHVFFGASSVYGADPKDVKTLGRQYWISRHTIFFADRPITPVDFSTFSVPGDNELAFSAEDKDHYFLGNRALNKAECTKVGEIVLACKGYIFAASKKYTEIDAASLHYLGRFPHLCQVIENSMIYQDDHGIYEFYGDGIIMKFLGFQPDRRYESLDKTLKGRLCEDPVTQSLKMDQ